MKYAWQLPGWPSFEFAPEHIHAAVEQYTFNEGMRIGIASTLPPKTLQFHSWDSVVTDAVSTHLIEGEHINQDDAATSLRRYLGLSRSPGVETTDGIIAMLMDLHGDQTSPLTHSRLHSWHRFLLHGKHITSIGEYRSSDEPMHITSGDMYSPKVHYIAPPAVVVETLMDEFLIWFNNPCNQTMSAPVRAGIAHLWFEQIHPYEDGNGRIGRAIAAYALAQSTAESSVVSLSDAIYKDRNKYYRALENSNSSLGITAYLEWFVTTCLTAQEYALTKLRISAAQMRYWSEFATTVTDTAQKMIIDQAFDECKSGCFNGIAAGRYAKLAQVSRQTSSRHLSALVEAGALVKLIGGGRSTRYAPASEALLNEVNITPSSDETLSAPAIAVSKENL